MDAMSTLLYLFVKMSYFLTSPSRTLPREWAMGMLMALGIDLTHCTTVSYLRLYSRSIANEHDMHVISYSGRYISGSNLCPFSAS